MKTIYIPKGETVRYESVVTENLVVKGCLEVAYGVSAKHISGGGIIHAQSISADTIRADELEAGIVTCKRLIAKRVSAPEVFASESAAVSCLLSAAYVKTGRLTVAISDIDEVKANEVINLTPKKRGLFGTLLASAFRAFWLSCFAKPVKPDKSEVMDAEYTPVEVAVPQTEAVADAAVPEDFIPEGFAAEEQEDFELMRIIAQFKLARESGYTLRLIPGTPEKNAPVFPFDVEQAVVRPAA
ncbi:MAG: hypothetical protein RR949_04305 [Oscillospiraceae bacterium]